MGTHVTSAHIVVVSVNVLALDLRSEIQAVGRQHAARTLRLDQQFHDAKVQCLGIQEARTDQGRFTSDHSAIFASGADRALTAMFGCEFWIHRSLPLFTAEDGAKLHFGGFKPCVIVADPHRLIVRFDACVF